MFRITHLVAAFAAASLLTAPVHAQELTGTLKKNQGYGRGQSRPSRRFGAVFLP